MLSHKSGWVSSGTEEIGDPLIERLPVQILLPLHQNMGGKGEVLTPAASVIFAK